MEFKQKNIKYLFPVFAFIFIVVYFLLAPFSQLKSYNIMNKLTYQKRLASDKVALVVIDDKSLREIGRWPWKREYYLEIFDFIENYTDAKLIGYDGVIMAPDLEHPESDRKFFSKIGDFKKLNAGFAFSYDYFENEEIERQYDSLLKKKAHINVIDKRSEKNKSQSGINSFTTLQKEYFKNIQSLGVVNVPEDTDGYVRQASQLVEYKGDLYPSLGLVIYSKYTGIDNFILTDNSIIGVSKDYSLRIPVKTDRGFVSNYISYYYSKDNVYSHKKYSASDVILSYRNIKQGKKPIINPNEFKDKVIFVGANAQAQALSDIGRTPISEVFSGLDIQATNFDNLLTNNFFKTTSQTYNFLICVFIFVLVFVLSSMLSIAGALFASTIVMFSFLIFAYFMYSNQIATTVMLPEIFVFVSLACTYSYKYFVEDTKKLKIQKAMGKYLSQDVMENVVKNIDNIELGGKRENITVLFADIRNFTSISENMDANSVSMILNEYFSAMVPVIEEFGGVLNKFMGDAVLAIFGEPKKSDNHALAAVRCGDKMLKKLKILQDKWLDEGKPRIEIGIGISTGDAFVGNIGSIDRLEYTVIGDTVNTASRIENFNKVYKTNFLISESTYLEVQNYVDVITIRNVAIRGKTNKMNIYEVIRLN